MHGLFARFDNEPALTAGSKMHLHPGTVRHRVSGADHFFGGIQVPSPTLLTILIRRRTSHLEPGVKITFGFEIGRDGLRLGARERNEQQQRQIDKSLHNPNLLSW